MVVSKDVVLPTVEELTVQEVEVGLPTLMAAAFHLGKACESANNEFILCRKENKDPRKCLDLGKAVTACSLNFFRQVKKSCAQEFTQFATCLEKSSSDFSFEPCRKTQAVLDKCMLDNLGLERPYYGYFSEVKVLHSDQPRPEVPKTEFPDVPARVAEEETQQASKFGSRKYFMN